MFMRVSTRILPCVVSVLFNTEGTPRKATPKSFKKEHHPYYDLSVKILRAKNIVGGDFLYKAGCYVSLHLPTASAVDYRTKTISNNNNPEWDETFKYRIQSMVKHVLELSLYDATVKGTKHLSTVAFDIGKIEHGSDLKTTVDLKDDEQLEVEFHLAKCNDPPVEILTNGVLVAQPCTCVETKVKKVNNLHQVGTVSPVPKDQSVDLRLKAKKCYEDLDVRLNFDIADSEKEFLVKRKKFSARALKKVLNLKKTPKDSNVPVIAILASGGGVRAMTSLYGILHGLQQIHVLDCVTYIIGVSGSTWCMSTLYQDANWSLKDLKEHIEKAKEQVTKSKTSALSKDRLGYYINALVEKNRSGHNVSVTDLWGLIIESFLSGKLKERTRCVCLEDKARWSPQQLLEHSFVKPQLVPTPSTCNEDSREDSAGGTDCAETVIPNSQLLTASLYTDTQKQLSRYYNEFEELQLLGEGAFGAVIKVKNKLDGCCYAVKRILVNPSSKHFRRIKGEVTLLSRLNHENIVRYYNAWIEKYEIQPASNPSPENLPETPPQCEVDYQNTDDIEKNAPPPVTTSSVEWSTSCERSSSVKCTERELSDEDDDEEDVFCASFLNSAELCQSLLSVSIVGVPRTSEEDKINHSFVLEAEHSPYSTLNFTYTPDDFDKLVDLNCYNVMNSKDIILMILSKALTKMS
ncbi:cytosolic phospholipase A2 zeta-like [Rhincodon typus]|uniref:cytosolic phospholipase A2 zeta-like n=1 Tax=Rhincodon typus TaxID=259920 RepID=UPI00202F2B52|nr:cytosolic phospholipase A2 zeta-like [Rhincodon typus]